MQGINCIKGEIHNVLTVLRLNSSHSGAAQADPSGASMEAEEHALIRGLRALYEHLCVHSDLAHVDTLLYLRPFLSVITSRHTDIFTTAIALHSIHKFLVYGLIHAESPNVAAALTQIADSVTHCTFDVTDGEDAEVVSMKILEILLECLRCSAGEFLTDQAVLDTVTEAFHVRSQQHSSKLLRRYAENVLMQMVLVLFARISPETSNAHDLYNSRSASPAPSPMLQASRQSSGIPLVPLSASPSPYGRSLSNASGSSGFRRSLSVHSTIKDWNTSTELMMQRFNASNAAQAAAAADYGDAAAGPGGAAGIDSFAVPYGIPALHRVFRFLTNLINPGDARNSEQDRILGLRLIRTVLETSGSRIGSFPPLIQVIQEELSKYLLQNSQTKNLFVLSLILRIVFDLFSSVKQHLKIQLEVFFTSIHLRIGESASSSFAQKELVLESLVEFTKEVSLIVGLYRNYDCELGCTDLFSDLNKFLAGVAMQPWGNGGAMVGGKALHSASQQHLALGNSTPNQLNLLSLEGMVAVLNAIVKRFCSNYVPQHLQQQQSQQQPQQLHDSTRLGVARDPSSGMRLSPAMTPSHSVSHSDLRSQLMSGGSGGGSGSSFFPGAGGEESDNDDPSALLILNPEEEASIVNKRANKQRLALAADQFNREGLNKETVKYLQGLKILPPSSAPPPADEPQPPVTSPVANATDAAPNADGPPSSGKKKVPFVPKSKYDPLIPPLSIVRFFRETPGLDKAKIGAYLGDADPFNIRVLDAFVDSFDFQAVPKTMTSGAHSQSTQQQQQPSTDPAAATEQTAVAATPTAAGVAAAVPKKQEISLDDALRSFLDCFVLPGESQQIARIIERFSVAYFSNCGGPLKSSDAAYVLCYSVIMLNTDAHNPQVTRKMTKDSYIRNLRGINEREDLPRAYLEDLFDSIVNNEIKIKSDSIKDVSARGDDGWNRVLANRQGGGHAAGASSFHVNAPRAHGREMFLLVWQSSVSVFIHYLEHVSPGREGWMANLSTTSQQGAAGGAGDMLSLPSLNLGASSMSGSGGGGGASSSLPLLPPPVLPSVGASKNDHLKTLPKILQGFSYFARICAVYNLNDILNHLVISLCKSVLGFLDELAREANWSAKDMAVGFARDLRLSHLLTALFGIVHEYGPSHILEGWSNVIHVLLWLREMELLPAGWQELEDFRDSTGRPLESLRNHSENTHLRNKATERRKAREAKAKESGGTGGGIGSFFSFSFFGGKQQQQSPQGSSSSSQHQQQQESPTSAPVYTPAESYWVAKSREVMSVCAVPQLFEESRHFRPATLAHLVRALMLISSAGTKSLAGSSVALSNYSSEILHEESAVFCLERLADVIEKNQSRLNTQQTIKEEHLSSAAPAVAATASSPPSSAVASPSATPTTTTSLSSIHLWSTIAHHFELSISNVRGDASCTFYIERLVVNLLRFSVRLVYSAETTSQLIALLALLLQLPKSSFATLAQRIIAGTSLFLQTHGESIRSAAEWNVVLSLLGQFKHHALSAHAAFTTFVYAVDNHANMETFTPLLTHLTAYAQPESDNDAWMPVAPEAVIQLLLKLHSKLGTLAVPEPPPAASPVSLSSQLRSESASQRALLSPAQINRRAAERERARTDLWLASLQNLCELVRNDSRSQVRKAALDALNNCLLAVGVSPPIAPLGWKTCFEKLLIPLLEGVQRYGPEPVAPSKPASGHKAASAAAAAASAASSASNNASGPARGPDDSSRPHPAPGVFDLRLKAATLVFQTWLHHLEVLAEMHDFAGFWLKFVASLERYMRPPDASAATAGANGAAPLGSRSISAGSNSALALHFSESLKNLLLVMHSTGVFDAMSARMPAGSPSLLTQTWTVLDGFRPELRAQLQEHIEATSAVQARTTKTEPNRTNSGNSPMHGSKPLQQQQRQQQQQQPQQPQQQQQSQFQQPPQFIPQHPLQQPPKQSHDSAQLRPPPAYSNSAAPLSSANAPAGSFGPTVAAAAPPAAASVSLQNGSILSRLSAPSMDFSKLSPLHAGLAGSAAGQSAPSSASSSGRSSPASSFQHSRASQFHPISPVVAQAAHTQTINGASNAAGPMHSPTPTYNHQSPPQQQQQQQQSSQPMPYQSAASAYQQQAQQQQQQSVPQQLFAAASMPAQQPSRVYQPPSTQLQHPLQQQQPSPAWSSSSPPSAAAASQTGVVAKFQPYQPAPSSALGSAGAAPPLQRPSFLPPTFAIPPTLPGALSAPAFPLAPPFTGAAAAGFPPMQPPPQFASAAGATAASAALRPVFQPHSFPYTNGHAATTHTQQSQQPKLNGLHAPPSQQGQAQQSQQMRPPYPAYVPASSPPSSLSAPSAATQRGGGLDASAAYSVVPPFKPELHQMRAHNGAPAAPQASSM